MLAIAAEINRIVDDEAFPTWVECRFCDAWGKEHIVCEKLPVVSALNRLSSSDLPCHAELPCELLRERAVADGRKIATVTTQRPWGIETVEGKFEFDVEAASLKGQKEGKRDI